MLKSISAKKLKIALLVVIIIATGFIREFIFVNINLQLKHLYRNTSQSWMHESLSFLKPLTYNQLYWTKWALTALFTLIYFFLTIRMIKLIFETSKFFKIIAYAFGAVVTAAILSYLVGLAFNEVHTGYKFARIFMGIAQSPLLLMFLIPAFFLASAGAKKS